jgi:parallel beta-helix repeat protein
VKSRPEVLFMANTCTWVLGALVLVACAPVGSSDATPDSEAALSAKHSCGNGICNGKKTCSSCPQDCGACPAPPPTEDAGTSPPATAGVGPQATITCPAGAVSITTSQDIPSVVASYPAGTSFCIRAGVHTPSSPVMPKANDVLVGEYGAIIDGANVTMTYDIGSTSVIRGWNCGGAPCTNVTIRNLVVRNSPGRSCVGVYENGATAPGTGWKLDHNEMYGCKFGGSAWSYGETTYNNIHDNECGTGGYRISYGVFDHNEIANNRNSGCKWAAGDHLTITNNKVHDNRCVDCSTGMNVGIWLDTVGGGNVISGNVVSGHDVGIMYEATDSGRVDHNTVNDNSLMGIYNSNSNFVEIDHNTIRQPVGVALDLFEDPATGYVIHDNSFHDNFVDLTAHADSHAIAFTCAGGTTTCASDYGLSRNNRFDFNTYATGGHTSYGFWVWGWSRLNWTQWRAIPQDANGTLQ